MTGSGGLSPHFQQQAGELPSLPEHVVGPFQLWTGNTEPLQGPRNRHPTGETQTTQLHRSERVAPKDGEIDIATKGRHPVAAMAATASLLAFCQANTAPVHSPAGLSHQPTIGGVYAIVDNDLPGADGRIDGSADPVRIEQLQRLPQPIAAAAHGIHLDSQGIREGAQLLPHRRTAYTQEPGQFLAGVKTAVHQEPDQALFGVTHALSA